MQFTADIYPLGIARYMVHARGTERFFTDADQGTLPAFSIVDPDFKSYSEENPHDIKQGESFASEVIKRVMHGKGWADTLLIWLYDEHGGYYDHVRRPPRWSRTTCSAAACSATGPGSTRCSGCWPRDT